MSVSSEISRLETAKANLKTAINNKGVAISAGATLEDYPSYVNLIATTGSDIKIYNLSALTTAAAPQTLAAAKSYDVIKYNEVYYLYGGYYANVVWYVKCTQAANTTMSYADSYFTTINRINFAYTSAGAISSVSSYTGYGTNLEDSRTAVGTWLWTPRLDWGGTITNDNTYSINFTSNNTNYTKIEFDAVGYDLFYGSTSVAYGRSASSPSASQTTWGNTSYRTIKITGGTDVKNSTLLTILRNNAFKYIG